MSAFEYQNKEEKEVFDEETFDEILMSLNEISYSILEQRSRYSTTQKAISELKGNMKKKIREIMSNILAMTIALSIMAGIPISISMLIKKSKKDNSLVQKTEYTYQMDGSEEISTAKMLIKDAKEMKHKEEEKYIILSEPTKDGYMAMSTYYVTDIDLPSIDDYFDLDLSKIEKHTWPKATWSRIISDDSENTEDIKECKKLIIDTFDYDNVELGEPESLYYLLYVVYIFILVALEVEYSYEFNGRPLLTDGIIFLIDKIKDLKLMTYNKKKYDKKIKEILNRINETISQSEELSRKWNEEFERNKDLMSDPSLLLSKYDIVIKEIKRNTMKLEM